MAGLHWELVFTEGAVCSQRQTGAQPLRGATHVAGKWKSRMGLANAHVAGRGKVIRKNLQSFGWGVTQDFLNDTMRSSIEKVNFRKENDTEW